MKECSTTQVRYRKSLSHDKWREPQTSLVVLLLAESGGDGALMIFCARRAPTIKRWSLDARNGDHTSRLAGYG